MRFIYSELPNLNGILKKTSNNQTQKITTDSKSKQEASTNSLQQMPIAFPPKLIHLFLDLILTKE